MAARLAERNRAGLSLRKRGLHLGSAIKCIQCGKEVWAKPSTKRKYCSRLCYRRYLAGRFDRWIASPQRIATLQNYDEFLTQEELPCLVEGCNWRGMALGYHMNVTHGVPKDEFKRAAGFNLGTGVIAAPLSDAMAKGIEKRARAWAEKGFVPTPPPLPLTNVCSYVSRESFEHRAKASILLFEQKGDQPQLCCGCEKSFVPNYQVGGQKYCTSKCRDQYYRRCGFESRRIRRTARNCVGCGTLFVPLRQNRQIWCSARCWQIHRAVAKEPMQGS
jgi:endogenous inhibitor of DNA gyrase (YacG/DUF329 family)